MPHLHLPTGHTDDDILLAANLAEVVGSEDLYVAWCHDRGPGVVPEVDAVLVERRVNPIARFFAGIRRALLRRPGRGAAPRQGSPPPRRTPA